MKTLAYVRAALTEMASKIRSEPGAATHVGREEIARELDLIGAEVKRALLVERAANAVHGLDLDAIEARAEATSTRPWCLDRRHPFKVYCDDSVGSMVADCFVSHALVLSTDDMHRNAEFIAGAPTDVLALVAALRKASRAAAYWEVIKAALSVDGDLEDDSPSAKHAQWIVVDENKLHAMAQEGWTHSVESILDAVLAKQQEGV